MCGLYLVWSPGHFGNTSADPYDPTFDVPIPDTSATYSASIALSEVSPPSVSPGSGPISVNVKQVQDTSNGIIPVSHPFWVGGPNIKMVTYDVAVQQGFVTAVMTIFSWNGNLPTGDTIAEIQTIDVVLLYDKDTGQVRDAHYVGTVQGVRPTTQDQSEQRALHLAKEKGLETSQLMALHVSQSDLKPKVTYRVDIKAKRLVALS
jgi:hypothetical protein